MDPSRRSILTALGLLPFVGTNVRASMGKNYFITCAQKPNGSFVAVVIDETGIISSLLPLPARGHGIAISPNGKRAVIFARRPETFMIAFSLNNPNDAVQITAMPGRHFYGHGCFSSDGKHLFTTENAYDEAQGTVGVYDVQDNFKRLDEFSSGGVGPHEIIALHDNQTLAVANGGIETHPDYPRRKLNLASMAPNLSYIEAATGMLLEKVEPPTELHQLSLRHLAQANNDSVWIGGQYEGPAEHQPPLIGVHERGKALNFITEPSSTAALRNYVGSLASSTDGTLVGITSPRGGVVQIWRASDTSIVTQYTLDDVCGISSIRNDFIASDGAGKLWLNKEFLSEQTEWSWDNHMAACACT